MKLFRGSAYVLATSIVVAGCSVQPDDRVSPGPETVTVTYSSSTSNAPTTQTVTSSPSSTKGSRTSSSSSSSASGTSSSSASSSTSSDDTDEDEELPGTAAAYADAFVRAWGRGDRASASTYGTSAAVSALFGGGSGGSGWQRTSSTGYAGSTEVTYSDGSRSLTVIVDHTPLGTRSEHAVTSAAFTADDQPTPPSGDGLPQTANAYTDAFVRAWGKLDASAWSYANDRVEAVLGSGPGPNPGAWSRTSSASGSAIYRNSDGSVLLLDLDTSRVSAGRRDAIIGATLS